MSLVSCGGCGKEVSSDYKFCPYCGSEIDIIQQDETAQAVSGIVELIICSNCGDENPASDKTCNNCGTVLSGNKIEKQAYSAPKPAVKPEPAVKQVNTVKPVQKNKKQKSKAAPGQQVKQANDFSNQKILLIFGGILVIALVVMFASGAFDSPAPVATQEAMAPQQEQPGVDLSMMQKINEFESAVQANPADMEKTLQLGHMLMDSRLFERAIIYYKKFLAVKPADTDVMVDMGVCFFELRDYATADSVMQSALKINPRHQIALMNLGVVNMNWGKMDKAKDWLQKAVDVNPSSEQGIRAKSLLESH